MWWVALAWAVEPAPRPEGLTDEVLEDIDRWERDARALIDGPQACLEVKGRARTALAVYTPGGWLGPGERRDLVAIGTFTGVLDHGKWTRLDTVWQPIPGADKLKLGRVRPIVGKLDLAVPDPVEEGEGADGQVAHRSGDALGLLDEILHDIDPQTSSSYTRWDGLRSAVVLHDDVPLKKGRGNLEMETAFPNAGPAMFLDVALPKRIQGGEGMFVLTLVDGQLHLRGQVTPLGLLPAEEGASTVAGFLGFTVGIDQHLFYDRARPCTAAASPPSAPPADGSAPPTEGAAPSPAP